MSDLFEELFDAIGDLAGEAVGKVAELAAEGGGAAFEAAVGAAGAVARGAGPALAGAARGAGHLAGAAAEGVAMAASEGLVEGAIELVGSGLPDTSASNKLRDTSKPPATADSRSGSSQGQARTLGRPQPDGEARADGPKRWPVESEGQRRRRRGHRTRRPPARD